MRQMKVEGSSSSRLGRRIEGSSVNDHRQLRPTVHVSTETQTLAYTVTSSLRTL